MLKPILDKVIVKAEIQEAKTAGGLVIPTTSTEKPSIGIVEAISEGIRLEDGTIKPLFVNVGDKVLFSQNAGDVIKFDNDVKLILKESDIIAIIE